MAAMTTIEDSKWLKLNDIIGILKKAGVAVSRGTFDRWVKIGYFPTHDIRIGASKRWTEQSFKDWLKQCVADAQKE